MGIFTYSRNGKFLNALSKDGISTFKVEADGKLTFIHSAKTQYGGADLKTDRTDSYLVAPDYRKSVVSVWKLEDGIYKGQAAQELKLKKGGLHSSRFSKNNAFLLVPSTKANRIYEMPFDAKTGQLSMKSEALGPQDGAKQPRHLVFHPNMDVAYTTMERELPGVASWKWDPAEGKLEPMQNLPCVDEVDGHMTTADLHISPDQKFLFASLRAENSKIFAYSIDPKDGHLSFIASFDCEKAPRSFCINKTGDFVYVGEQHNNTLGAYRVDRETGHLKRVTEYKTGSKPIWVETLAR